MGCENRSNISYYSTFTRPEDANAFWRNCIWGRVRARVPAWPPLTPTPTLTLSAGKAHTRFPGNDGVWELLGWNRNRPGERLVSVVCFVNQTSESRLGLGMRKAGLWE